MTISDLVAMVMFRAEMSLSVVASPIAYANLTLK